MTTITVEIEKDNDLPALEAALRKLGLKYRVDENDEDWGDLSEAEIEGIKEGIADSAAGRIHSHKHVMNHINAKIKGLIESKND